MTTLLTTEAAVENNYYYHEEWYYQLVGWYNAVFEPWRRYMHALVKVLSGTWVPIFLLIGFVGNAFIITLMPVARGISKKAKMFYLFMGGSDLAVLLLVYIPDYLEQGLRFDSHDQHSYSIYNFSHDVTLFVYVCWDFSKSCSAYYLMLFTAQRAIVVTFPFSAHIFTSKRNVLMLAGLTIWSLSVPCWTTIPYFLCNWSLCPWIRKAVILHGTMTFFLTLIPLPVIVISTLVVPVSLLGRSRLLHVSATTKPNKSSLSSAEIRNSLVAIFMALVYVGFVGFNHLMQFFNYALYQLGWHYAFYWLQFNLLGALGESLSCIAYAINAYIYIFFYTGFRKAVKSVLICQCKQLRNQLK